MFPDKKALIFCEKQYIIFLRSELVKEEGGAMSVLCDHIESFIQAQLKENRQTDLRRNELAESFRCAPSQINYVLSTRFTIERGYRIESRRGGGGFVRIVRFSSNADDYLMHLAKEGIGHALSELEANHILDYMLHLHIISGRETRVMRAALSDNALSIKNPTMRDVLRANIGKSFVLALLTE